MSEKKYEPLRVWLDTEGTDIYESKYNNSYSLWEYIKMEINDFAGEDSTNVINRLGLYGPDYHALSMYDARHGIYIQTYTIGDLLHFLNYNYHYDSLYCPECEDGHRIINHRRLAIIPIPVDKIDRTTMHTTLDSSKKNMRKDYVWRICIGDEELAENAELVDALHDAVKEVYLNRKLYKIALQDESIGVQSDKRFNVTDATIGDEFDVLNVYKPRVRAETLENGENGEYRQVYDIGDYISFLYYNYYINVNMFGQNVQYNRRLTISPEPVNYIYDENHPIADTLNNRTHYKWYIKIGADIIGCNVHLIDALAEAVDNVYKNTNNLFPEPLYKTILEEITNSDIEYEEQKEFSLADV